ncbi:YihY/virulence factor BrkB family protein [Pendulispora albinea]|uniref:YihY/virulence factor BrkB family protein n=1 Tax=Pendulispora albinea TaxID=2741071 RepID=A0ABZ2LSZ8_9BACT
MSEPERSKAVAKESMLVSSIRPALRAEASDSTLDVSSPSLEPSSPSLGVSSPSLGVSSPSLGVSSPSLDGSSPSLDLLGPPSSRTFQRIPWHVRARVLARNVAHGLYVHHAFDHAAAMAFYFFLGIIPLLVSCGMIVGQIVRTEGSDAFLAPLYRIMPPIAADLLRGELVDIASSAASAPQVAPITLLVFLWLTSNGFHNLMDVFELLTAAQRRSWLRKRIIAVGWVLGIFVVVAAATWILLRGSGLLAAMGHHDWLPKVVRRVRELLEEGWQRQGIVLLFAAISVLGLATFYRFAIVHPPGVKRHVWSGTAVAIVLWGLASWGFSAYVKTLANYALYYGGVATMATTLLWLYLTSLALVIGAEVNAQLEGIRASTNSMMRRKGVLSARNA